MKNILKICLIAILTMALLFTVVACGGEKTPDPDNGGENNGGENNGGENNGGENNGGENNGTGGNEGGEDEGGEDEGDEGGEEEDDGTIEIVTDTEGVWGDVNFIG